jgi:hypothetical protein
MKTAQRVELSREMSLLLMIISSLLANFETATTTDDRFIMR